jgi:hypothetical protein
MCREHGCAVCGREMLADTENWPEHFCLDHVHYCDTCSKVVAPPGKCERCEKPRSNVGDL